MKIKCYGDKCIENNIKHEKSDLILDGKKRYCKECLDIKRKDIEERGSLYKVIQRIFLLDSMITPQGKYLMKQVKRHKDSGMSYEDMKIVIEYIEKNTNIKFDIKYGLGILPNFYNEAIENYKDYQLKSAMVMNSNINNDSIKVYTKKLNDDNSIINSRLIDMNNII